MNNIKFFKKSILFEDNHLIIINKKPGELTLINLVKLSPTT